MIETSQNDMLGCVLSSSRDNLSPQEALELANIYLENARKSDNPNLILEWCYVVEAALSRIKGFERKSFTPPKTVDDQALYDGVSTVYIERGTLLDGLGHHDKAQVSFRMAEKWRYVQNTNGKFVHPRSDSRLNCVEAVPDLPSIETDDKSVFNNVTQVLPEIFSKDVARPVAKYDLPKPDERITSAPQLAYCLGLLSMASSLLSSPSSSSLSPLPGAEPDVSLDEHQRAWILATLKNEDESERLHSLATNLVRAFIDDTIKDPSAVAEMVYLAPILDHAHYRRLLGCFMDDIRRSTLLDFNLLEGLAPLLQRAAPGFLHADDLVNILEVLNVRLQVTHQQSIQHLHQLALVVSHVLDIMADSNVKDLSREQLHAPLSAYLDGLKNSSDPYLVYQAAYAYQALQYVPDDETPLQSIIRRTQVLYGVSGLLTSFKNLDTNGFLDGLGQLHEGPGEVFQVAKSVWYPALRAIDTFLRDGRLVDFKKLVYDAPCRRNPIFEWGLCQRLGEIAINPLWDAITRCSAIDFLGEMYKNDADWGQQASVKQIIIVILTQLSNFPEAAIKSRAHTVLQDMKTNGDAKKQEMYRAFIDGPPSPYPLKVYLPPLVSSSLLSRIQDISGAEDGLRMLKARRLEGRFNDVYIPPQAKASLQASNDVLFPLMEKVKEFLSSDRQVLLLLGDSGAGKSNFNRELEYDLWNSYKEGNGRIPLHIHLPAIDKPDKDLITKHLRMNDFTESQIRELKHHRELILICDGYDQCQQSHNLYTSNQLNQPGQWKAKMVISCRTEYLSLDYKDRFQPKDQNTRAMPELFQEAVIVPFSGDQIEEYIEQYVSLDKRAWKTKDYLEALYKVPNLLELVRNPFLLTLSLEVLPRVVDGGRGPDLTGTRITRVELYDEFVEQWLERGKRRIGENELGPQAEAAFDTLVEGGFTQTGIDFLKRLASTIYKEQEGHPVVEYLRSRDERTWKTAFFSREEKTQLLREACPLIRNGDQYRFIHQTLLEYCFTLAVFDPQESRSSHPPFDPVYGVSVDSASGNDKQGVAEEELIDNQQLGIDHPLTWRSFVGEPSILAFLAERVQQEPQFKRQLRRMIELSKTDKGASTAAANAMTILVRAGIQFKGEDLRGIRIPGADLSGGVFDSAQLQGADLSRTNLRNIWLRQANLSQAHMAGVQFGELPYLTEHSKVYFCAYSLDGKTCATGLSNGNINVYETSTWTKAITIFANTDAVLSAAYSPSGQEVALGSADGTMRLCSVQTGAICLTLNGHTDGITSIAYSPSGQQITTSSTDRTVRLWNVQTGEANIILKGHTDAVLSVAYSPGGQQIASGSNDETVRLWDAQTGAPGPILSGHTRGVTSVAYSPNGQQIVSGSYDMTVRLWDAQTGTPVSVLSGHTERVSSVVYSPSGLQIASGSDDSTVRLWDTETGTPGLILTGHTGSVASVVFSPSGQQIVSGSADETVRFWNAQAGAPGAIISGHTSTVTNVVYSPSGQQIVSGSQDNTVRLWDAQTGAPGPILSGHIKSVASVVYSPSGQQIASGSQDNTVRLWDAQTGAPGLVLSGHTSCVTSVVYSPNGQQIASGSNDMTVRLRDTQTGAFGPILFGHTDYVTSVVYSPSGQQIASGSGDKTVRLWDAGTGTPWLVLSGHTDYVTSVVYSPNGQQIASGSQDKTVRLWDALTGALGRILSGHTSSVTNVVYSPNGKQIASGSDDMTVRLWNAETGAPGPVLRGHVRMVTSVAYSPNGQQIATGSGDKTVRLWDVDSGECLAIVSEFHGPINSISWSTTPGGTFFATGCGDKSVRIWQVMEERNRCNVRLCWGSIQDRLAVSDIIVQDTYGLSDMNTRLLTQRNEFAY